MKRLWKMWFLVESMGVCGVFVFFFFFGFFIFFAFLGFCLGVLVFWFIGLKMFFLFCFNFKIVLFRVLSFKVFLNFIFNNNSIKLVFVFFFKRFKLFIMILKKRFIKRMEYELGFNNFVFKKSIISFKMFLVL